MGKALPSSRDHRPDFMITLGLAPPYALADVKQAYRDKARATHPDRGGSTAAFNEVQQAFERAQAYLEFRGDRRGWIAAKMGRYAELQKATDRLRRLGAVVTTHAPEWLEASFGDFAQLTETVTAVRLTGSGDGDAVIRSLVADHHVLRELETLALPHCRVSDDAVLSLMIFQQLQRLDLSHTPVTRRSLALIDAIKSLESLRLDGTSIGWWSKRRVKAKLRRRGAMTL
jgi:hypothetical protein